jgi:2-polyprenyl-3-methyl-5-hydroxy-6-metoxy-1,4-benzoquinol methylase
VTFVDYFTQVQATQGWDAILASFARFVAPPEGAFILDVGCGPGSLVRRLAGMGNRVVGVDQDPGMTAQADRLAKGLAGTAFCAASIASLPFRPGAFDVVLATNIIFFLDDPQAGVRALAAACRVSGTVAMLNPSERMSTAAAEALANERGLAGTERASLVNWAGVAEGNRRFDADEASRLFAAAGIGQIETVTKIGPGLARYVRGVRI